MRIVNTMSDFKSTQHLTVNTENHLLSSLRKDSRRSLTPRSSVSFNESSMSLASLEDLRAINSDCKYMGSYKICLIYCRCSAPWTTSICSLCVQCLYTFPYNGQIFPNIFIRFERHQCVLCIKDKLFCLTIELNRINFMITLHIGQNFQKNYFI